MGFEGRRVRVESRGRDDVAELPDGVESAVAVGVEIALDAGPGRRGQANHLGPRNPVGGQPENLHPPLDLRSRVVEPVGGDLGEDIHREVERAHGILPAWSGTVAQSTPGVRAVKSSIPAAQGIARPNCGSGNDNLTRTDLIQNHD